jgi:hypothetical protein
MGTFDPHTDHGTQPRGPVPGWPRWRQWLFAVLSSACVPLAEYYNLPPERTTEMEVPADASLRAPHGTKR